MIFKIYMTSQLILIQCLSCGNQLGHLYKYFYNCSHVIHKDHQGILDDLSKFDKDEDFKKQFNVEHGKFTRNLWDTFLKTYYTWLLTDESKPYRELYTAKSLILQALLSKDVLDKEKLPLNFSSPDAVRYCCRSVFLCDNSKAPY